MKKTKYSHIIEKFKKDPEKYKAEYQKGPKDFCEKYGLGDSGLVIWYFPEWKTKRFTLTNDQKEQIRLMLIDGASARTIAMTIGCSVSYIDKQYRDLTDDEKAQRKINNPQSSYGRTYARANTPSPIEAQKIQNEPRPTHKEYVPYYEVSIPQGERPIRCEKTRHFM